MKRRLIALLLVVFMLVQIGIPDIRVVQADDTGNTQNEIIKQDYKYTYKKDKSIISLDHSSTALVDENNKLYIWGEFSGLNGKCIATNVEQVNLSKWFYESYISTDKELYMWGYNYDIHGDGQVEGLLGIGVSDKKYYEPTKVLDNVKMVDCGWFHNCAVTYDGKLYMWGDNSGGQLGDGSTIDSNKPKQILEEHKVKLASVGGHHSAAVTEAGDLYMWGKNDNAQLGDGTTNNMYYPTYIMSGVKSVELGGGYTAIIKENGDLYMCGFNMYGQIGDGTSDTAYKPKYIMSDVESVSCGEFHTAALKKNGDLYLWGKNEEGQIGDGTTNNRYTPVQIMSNVEIVSVGNGHSAAIKSSGEMFIWGNGGYGRLCTGNYKSSNVPIKIKDNIMVPENTTLISETNGFDLKKDGYSFANTRETFGYKETSKYPLARYIEVYGEKYNWRRYLTEGVVGGNCGGMTITSIMFKENLLDSELYKWGKGNVNKSVHNLQLNLFLQNILGKEDNVNERVHTGLGIDRGILEMTADKDSELGKLIERYQLWQFTKEGDYAIFGNPLIKYENEKCVFRNNYNTIEEGLLDCFKDNYLLGVKNKKVAHSFVIDSSRGMEYMGNDWYRVYLYDPNVPYEAYKEYFGYTPNVECMERYMDVNISNGHFRLEASNVTGEKESYIGYTKNDEYIDGSAFYVVDYNDFPTVINGNFNFKDDKKTYINLNAPFLTMYNSNDQKILEIEDGKIVYEDNSIEREQGFGNSDVSSNINIALPQDVYTLEFKGKGTAQVINGNYFTGIVVDGDSNVIVSNAGETDVYGSDGSNINVVIEENMLEEWISISANIENTKESQTKLSLTDGELGLESTNENIDINVLSSEEIYKEYKLENVTTDFSVEGNVFEYAKENGKLVEIKVLEDKNVVIGEPIYFDGNENVVNPVVIYDGKVLVEGIDYEVSGDKKAILPGIYNITIEGKGECIGTVTKTFTINPASITDIRLGVTSYTYDGKAKTPSITVKCGAKTLINGTDYTVTYSNNVNVGTATVSVVGKGNYTGTISKTFKIKAKVEKLPMVKYLKQNAAYSTNGITLTWKKVEGVTGYEVYRATSKNGRYTKVATTNKTSYKNSKLKAGKTYYYKVRAYKVVNGSKTYGDYSAIKAMLTKSASPTIKLKARKKQVKITWSKVTGATGYEVYMATSKSGKYKKVKTLTAKKISFTQKKLTKGKKYFFKARTYRIINGKKVYSSWSKVKSVKVK